jgi:hypothetical protein
LGGFGDGLTGQAASLGRPLFIRTERPSRFPQDQYRFVIKVCVDPVALALQVAAAWAIFAAIRRVSAFVSSLAADSSAGLFLKINICKLLPVAGD